ncbi:MAG: MFS transporter [Acidobacteriota bacterium]
MVKASRSEIAGWALYDFGSSAFNTLVVTFIYSRFFAEVIAAGEDPTHGAILWTRAVNISAILVAVMMPLLGAVADYSGRKKTFLVGFALESIVFTCLLFFFGPGEAVMAGVLFVIANVGFESANVFYNAFLPEIASSRTMGRISGLGFFLGYIGGLISLALGLGMISSWLPEEGYLNIRSTLLLVAAWYLVFSMPLFFGLKDRAERRTASFGTYVNIGFGRLVNTVRHIHHLREAAKLLVARMIYNDGLVTVMNMAAIYTAAVMKMELDTFVRIAIALNVAAGIGAFGFGFIDDRIGGKKTLIITLLGLIVAGVIGVMWTSVTGFCVAATIIGVMMGPNQSASRSLFAKFVPEHKHGEMFGLFAFSGKMSSLFGPLAYGTVLSLVGSRDEALAHRLAMATIILFFFVGLGILFRVREKDGIWLADTLNEEYTAAQSTDSPD